MKASRREHEHAPRCRAICREAFIVLHRWIAAALVAALSLAAFDAARAAPTVADAAHKPAAKYRKHAPPAHA